MPKIQYQELPLQVKTRKVIDQANAIIAEYTAKGFDLTLRQLYYQFVARDLISNNQKEYKRLGNIINDARLAGLIDWDHITDRTRNVRRNSHWTDPADIIETCAASFQLDKWEGQEYRPEVWIEKDALVGVLDSVCPELDVPYFSCRGYVSQSEMWAAGMRLKRWKRAKQTPIVFHLGDHDPSGIDMTRDIAERLQMFCGAVEVKRLALNLDQVEEYQPPPNPAKVTDARFADYQAKFGDDSWELDALDPGTLAELIRDAVAGVRDDLKYDAAMANEDEAKRLLGVVSKQWEKLTRKL